MKLLVLALLAAGLFAGYRWSQTRGPAKLTPPPAHAAPGTLQVPQHEWLSFSRDIEARLKAAGSTNLNSSLR